MQEAPGSQPPTPTPAGAGAPPTPMQGMPPGPPGAPATRMSPLAITSLVLAIVAFCIALVPFLGLIIAIAAIILGVMGMRQCDQDPMVTGRGLAIAGLVVGIIASLSGLIWTIMFILAGAAFWQEFGEWENIESVGRLALAFMR